MTKLSEKVQFLGEIFFSFLPSSDKNSSSPKVFVALVIEFVLLVF